MKYIVTRKTVSAFSAVVEAEDAAKARDAFNSEGYAGEVTEQFSKSEVLVQEYTGATPPAKASTDAIVT